MSRLLRKGFSSLQAAYQVPKKLSKPLRVLFCGSDEFSSASLRALHAEHKRNPELVKSIDVMHRPGKQSGRSMKTIRDVPIKAVAQELGLPIHERDTFTGWQLPRHQEDSINLIVAVSFGLFVPPRILKSAEYGGLNIHPSLLPNFRGPAPLQHTILTGQTYTGVTLQTLHEKRFDHGLILAQTPAPGFLIPEGCTYSQLRDILSPMGAQMLVAGLQKGIHVPIVEASRDSKSYEEVHHAPKITSVDRQINWNERNQITRQFRALGRLWSEFYIDGITKKRCVFEDVEERKDLAFPTSFVRDFMSIAPKSPPTAEELAVKFVIFESRDGDKLPLFYVEDGDAIHIDGGGTGQGHSSEQRHRKVLKVNNITLEGQGRKPAAVVMRKLNRERRWKVSADRKSSAKERSSAIGNGSNWIVEELVEDSSKNTMN